MDPVIEQYQHLSGITGKMREAATLGDWDKLAELELLCSQHVSLMKKQNFAVADENTRLQKVVLINKILADDALIRDQTLPWLAQLQHNMQSNRNEQRVQQAYSSD